MHNNERSGAVAAARDLLCPRHGFWQLFWQTHKQIMNKRLFACGRGLRYVLNIRDDDNNARH